MEPTINNDIQAAQATEQQFLQQIAMQPKAALTGSEAPAQAAPPVEKKGIFSNSLFEKLADKADSTTTADAEPQPQPAQEPYKPFADMEAEPEQPQATAQQTKESGDLYYKKCLAIEQMKNMGISRLLAAVEGTPLYEQYKLSPEEEKQMAEALAQWKPKFVDDMPAYAQYAIVNATVYAPLVINAMQKGAVNRRNARIAAQIKPQAQPKPPVAATTGRTVPLAPQQQPAATLHNAKGERTRYEIHTDGTYMYSRSFPNRPPQYLNKYSPECEKVDLQDLEAIKRIILKQGSWKKTAEKLAVSTEWMEQRGLNTNNPKVAD